LRALIFTVRFQTAQFRVHHQKLTRRTYLIPPPSAVAGFFGAILGISRTRLRNFYEEKKLLAGAELCKLGGYFTTISRIYKFDRDAREIRKLLEEWLLRKHKRNLVDIYKDMMGLMPLKESEELFSPEYRYAIVANDEVIEEGLRRIETLDFEYDVFGGNDYHFVEYIGDAHEAKIVKSSKGRGYCPKNFFAKVESRNYRVILNSEHTLKENDEHLPIVLFETIGPEVETFVFVFRAEIITNREIDAAQDERSTIFVYDPVRYLVP